MMDNENNPGAKMELVSLKNLYLDPNNYRLIHDPAWKQVQDTAIRDDDAAARTYRLLVGDKYQNIQDLVESFKSNGYLPVDQIQVRPIDGDNFVVIEGNRRVAALKYLNNEYEQRRIDLDKLDKNIFDHVPVVIYDKSDEAQHLVLMGLKHISGNLKWGEWNQAKLLETLINTYKMSEDEVCMKIGIQRNELRRNVRALGLAKQYQKSDYGDQFKESMFPIFREATRNTVMKEWLQWDETHKIAKDDSNRDLFFSWLSRETIDEDTLDDDTGNVITFGKRIQEPAITKRDDIRILVKLLKDPVALEAFEKSRQLHESYIMSNVIFEERLNDALKAINTDVSRLSQMNISPEQVPLLEENLGKLRGIVEKARTTNKSVEQSTVFSNRVSSHFSCLDIIAYRGLENLKIDKLAKINLFAGINNSGKTSLLEAVYLLCKQNDFGGLIDILRRRGKIPEGQIPAKWLAEQISDTIKINAVFDNNNCTVELKPFDENNSAIDRSVYLKSVEIATRYENYQLESVTRLLQGIGRETQADTIKILCPTVFSSPFFLNEPFNYTGFYHKSVQSKLLPRIMTFIEQKFIPSLKDIRLVDEFQRFLVVDDNFEKALDLTSYGEGLQRVFFTSLLFASAENGIVLIDEFENAIHIELLEIFAAFIHSLAREFNVQVFLTSHSKECIDSFIKSVPPDQKKDFSFHALVQNENRNINSRDFDGEKFFKLLEAGDVDLRRAQ
ncbi:MAG: hypothetical protein Pg6C_04930 [Treponemataceae bacterium]|nr:MAG: hypothetical protein Pg6C_04930 [Treponemataceae bacterium]